MLMMNQLIITNQVWPHFGIKFKGHMMKPFHFPFIQIMIFLEPEEVKKPTVKKAAKSSGGSAKGKAKAKPAVRKFAKENGVDLNDVTGSGKNGIVTKDDVLAFMSQGQQASAPPPVFHPPTQQQAPSQPIQQTFKGKQYHYNFKRQIIFRITNS